MTIEQTVNYPTLKGGVIHLRQSFNRLNPDRPVTPQTNQPQPLAG